MRPPQFLLVLALVLTPVVVLANSAPLAPERQSVVIRQTAEPVFPRSLVEKGYTFGQVQIVISIDDTGKLSDWLIVSCSHRLFAEEAIWAIKQWKYDPARIRGEAVAAQVDLTVNFDFRGPVMIETNFGLSAEHRMDEIGRQQRAYGPCRLKELDRIPTPTTVVQPAYPESLRKQGVRGAVAVEFYINEKGQVQMPSVLSLEQPVLASLVVEALSQWQFEPPTRKGTPVLVKAKQVFDFNPQKP